MRSPENKAYSAQVLHRGAMNWARAARTANARKDTQQEQKVLAWALEYELKALDCLRSESRENIDTPSIILFSKYAATFAANLGDTQAAMTLLQDALARDPDPKMKDELLRLLNDVQNQSDAEAKQADEKDNSQHIL